MNKLIEPQDVRTAMRQVARCMRSIRGFAQMYKESAEAAAEVARKCDLAFSADATGDMIDGWLVELQAGIDRLTQIKDALRYGDIERLRTM